MNNYRKSPYTVRLLSALLAPCLAMALMTLTFLPMAPAMAQPQPPRDLIIQLETHELTAWAWGDSSAEPVLALPGSGADHTRYRELGALVATGGYRFIAINQRGIKGSSGSLKGLTLHDYADDIVGLMDALGINRAHLVGWAMGNRIQRMVATDHPDRVATVTLLAAGGLVAPTFEPGVLGRLLSGAELPLEEKIELARGSLFAPATDDVVVRQFALQLNYWPLARRSQQQANQAVPREQWWAGGNSPLLIIQGLDDRTAPPGNGRQMQQAYPGRVTLVEIADAGHLMGVEKPRETASAIIEFLQNHPL